MEIEETKLKMNELECKLNEKYIDITEKIMSRIDSGSIECVICAVNKADTAAIPCGHKFFCYECIDSYNQNFSHRGCPICRKDIMYVTKIFS